MRYRIEPDEAGYLIHAVETGHPVGRVIPHYDNHPRRQNCQIVMACTVLNRHGGFTAWIPCSPMQNAPWAIANYEGAYPPHWEQHDETSFEKHSNHGILNVGWYPPGCWVAVRDGRFLLDPRGEPVEFSTAKDAQQAADTHAADGYPGAVLSFDGLSWDQAAVVDPIRIEHRLGTLLADAVSVLARGLVEYGNGSLRPETKGEFGMLIGQLVQIWWVSRFYCFNSELRAWEPYFAGATAAHPRMSFADAAQHYGKAELRKRLPVDKAALSKLLSWVLEIMGSSLIASVYGRSAVRKIGGRHV
jgi:hypothetical protein